MALVVEEAEEVSVATTVEEATWEVTEDRATLGISLVEIIQENKVTLVKAILAKDNRTSTWDNTLTKVAEATSEAAEVEVLEALTSAVLQVVDSSLI